MLTYLVKKRYNEEFRGVYFLTIREKTLNEISYSWSFSSSNLKLSIASNTNIITFTTFFSFATELKIGHLLLLLQTACEQTSPTCISFVTYKQKITLGARDFSCAVSTFGQVHKIIIGRTIMKVTKMFIKSKEIMNKSAALVEIILSKRFGLGPSSVELPVR